MNSVRANRASASIQCSWPRRRLSSLLGTAKSSFLDDRDDLAVVVLVGALGPDGLAGGEGDLAVGPRNADPLRPSRDQVHLDAALALVPDRPMIEGREIEVRQQLAV